MFIKQEKLEKYSEVFVKEGRMVVSPVDPPHSDSFDLWTLVTAHHSVPNCYVTTSGPSINLDFPAADLKCRKLAWQSRGTFPAARVWELLFFIKVKFGAKGVRFMKGL